MGWRIAGDSVLKYRWISSKCARCFSVYVWEPPPNLPQVSVRYPRGVCLQSTLAAYLEPSTSFLVIQNEIQSAWSWYNSVLFHARCLEIWSKSFSALTKPRCCMSFDASCTMRKKKRCYSSPNNWSFGTEEYHMRHIIFTLTKRSLIVVHKIWCNQKWIGTFERSNRGMIVSPNQIDDRVYRSKGWWHYGDKEPVIG